MGLDMYLSKKTYIWSDKRKGLQIKGVDGIRASRVKEIIEDAGYWRKANAIHKWFVQNVQEGEDDCKEYYVSHEQLKSLLDLVSQVLDSSKLVKGKVMESYTFDKDGKKVPTLVEGKVIENTKVAEELLPTEEGFFFGGTEYDEYYYQDLVETKKILEEALRDKNGEFYYQSSW